MMNYSIFAFMGLSVAAGLIGMENQDLHLIFAQNYPRSENHTTVMAYTTDYKRIQIEVCTKLRNTRNANQYDLHYSGKIGKKRFTRAQARTMATRVLEAKERLQHETRSLKEENHE